MIYFKEDIPTECECKRDNSLNLNGHEECDDNTILFVSAECHPEGHTWTYYDHRDGTINVICGICESPVFTTPIMKKTEYLMRKANNLLS